MMMVMMIVIIPLSYYDSVVIADSDVDDDHMATYFACDIFWIAFAVGPWGPCHQEDKVQPQVVLVNLKCNRF